MAARWTAAFSGLMAYVGTQPADAIAAMTAHANRPSTVLGIRFTPYPGVMWRQNQQSCCPPETHVGASRRRSKDDANCKIRLVLTDLSVVAIFDPNRSARFWRSSG